MEGVGAAASVSQFVLIGLKLAKEIHNTLSAIRDGPAIVKLLAIDIISLQGILEQLARSPAAANDTALDGHVGQSIQNLCSRAEPIVKFQVAPKDKRAGRFWKRLKVVVGENDLHRIRAEVTQIVTVLNLRLGVSSNNTIHEVSSTNNEIQQQMVSMDASIKRQFDMQAASLIGVNSNILRSHSDEKNMLQADLASLKRTLDTTSAISTQNAESILKLCNELKDQMSVLASSRGQASGPFLMDADIEQDKEIQASINRLLSLVDEKREAIDVYAEDDDQAESVIEDFQTLLKTVRGQRRPIMQIHPRKHADDKDVKRTFLNEVRRLDRYFGAGLVSINSGENQCQRFSGKVVEQSRTLKETNTGNGKLSLLFHKRTRSTLEEDDRQTATCSERGQLNGAFSQARHHLFHDCRMLQDGTASLQDHDQYGASLLFESLKLAWNPEFVAPFADINSHRDKEGNPSFLQACENFGSGYTHESFQCFIELGANIHDRDYVGRTCLHICLARARRPQTQQEIKAIEYLVRRGADPRATDMSGKSVSEIAYTTRLRGPVSYVGDLWDAVLHRCGFNISEFRPGYQRRAEYYQGCAYYPRYTRQDFEILWSGRETECPYWDDEPWPPVEPGETEEDYSSDDSEPDDDRDCSKPFSRSSDSDQETDDDGRQSESDDEADKEPSGSEYQSSQEAESTSEAGDSLFFTEFITGEVADDTWGDEEDGDSGIITSPPSLDMDIPNPWL
ncbi:hypothetical protein FZEAL_8090 [Fusarium zealandicum]|uniref:Fungal N-terminal domain-containing protein n=1 Tax=Fusarium zealandicum TaxID=1053134 RepID=A0A8H4XI77_9HYPO|nr:hypothetical protein FZEAL_8090 [Fusarium zealandicum]